MIKSLKYKWQMLLTNSGACITDTDLQEFSTFLHKGINLYADAAAFGRKLERIGEQVKKYFIHFVRIKPDLATFNR